MRIIITNEGVKEISTISKNSSSNSLLTTKFYNPLNYNSNNDKSRDLMKSNSSSLIFSYQHLPKINQINIINNQNEKSNFLSSYNLSEINAPLIQIKTHKLQIPQEQNDLYDNDKCNDSFIVKQTNDILLNISNKNDLTNNNNSSFIKQNFTLGEIINENCFQKLKKKLIKEQIVNQNNKKINESDYRKYNDSNKVFKEIEKGKSTKISVNNNSLIEYLYNKKTISETLINNLSNCKEGRLNKINKICQKYIIGQEKEKLILEKSKEKIKLDKIREEEECKKDLELLKLSVDKETKTINNFQFKLLKSNRNRFSGIFNQFKKKYWLNNNNFQRYFRTKKSFKKIDYNELSYQSFISIAPYKKSSSVDMLKPNENNIMNK